MRSPFSQLTPSYRRILDAIWQAGSASRAEIAAHTGLTRPAITQMVQELIEAGLVHEQLARRGLRGQPARPIAVNGAAGFAAGVNFSHSYLDFALVDLGGTPIDVMKAPVDGGSPEAIGAVALGLLDMLVARHGLDRDRLIGVGISVPGDFNADGSLYPHALFPGLKGHRLCERFVGALDVDVMIENDGRACALGERVMGVGREYRNFMLVHLGHGVGGGLIVDGRPFRGALGNAGILGQFYPYGRPRPSGVDLLETLRAAGVQATDFDMLDDIADEAGPVVDQWVERAAAQLSGDLARVSRFFGPEAVIIAGRVTTAINKAIAQAIDMTAILRPMDDLPIVPVRYSALGSHAGVIGAAALPIFNLLLPNI